MNNNYGINVLCCFKSHFGEGIYFENIRCPGPMQNQAWIKENIKAPRHWPLCGESPVTGEFPAQNVSNVENVSIWWRHHVLGISGNPEYFFFVSIAYAPVDQVYSNAINVLLLSHLYTQSETTHNCIHSFIHIIHIAVETEEHTNGQIWYHYISYSKENWR